MKMSILLSTVLILVASCGTNSELPVKEEPDMPATSIPDNSTPDDNTTASRYFTAQSTVSEVINDALNFWKQNRKDETSTGITNVYK